MDIFDLHLHDGRLFLTGAQVAIVLAMVVAFAAFCVWLAVRIFNRRERWAKWTLAAVLSLPGLYVVSFGPVCWLSDRATLPYGLVDSFYRPLVVLGMYAHCDRIVEWYGTIVELPELPDPDIGTDCRLYTAVRIRVEWEQGQ